MISFQNVTKIYHCSSVPVVALSDVSFKVDKGELVSIVGKSGAGKTTIVRLLIGEDDLTEGTIMFNDIEIPKMSSKEVQELRRRIGVVHQDYKLIHSKNVRENVEYIMQVIGASDEDISRDVSQVLDLVGLLEREGNFPDELSGGEKQRLAIARALCHRPEIIIADEPTGNLDVYNTFEIVKLLKKIHKLGTTVILSTHNKDVIDSLEQRVITLEQGRVVKDNPKGKFIL